MRNKKKFVVFCVFREQEGARERARDKQIRGKKYGRQIENVLSVLFCKSGLFCL
jgi:hypothetical protein